jgi:transcriptional regulator with XRE-family HTH domain
MADTSTTPEHMSLSAKLLTVFRLRRTPDGFTPSAHDIAKATSKTQPGSTAVSHGQVNSLLNGSSRNPRSSTLTALAQALDVPAAFLLPGPEWDDLTALTVYRDRPEAREVLRLMQDLAAEDVVDIMSLLRKMRRDAGLSEDVPAIPLPPPGVDQPREGRPRRRLSLSEAAERAAADLEGR